ncbi:AzlC family ABC transporter permease [Poseidonocella sedimentorum]|uniref:Predicted branched-chain amino acid permease (Azaleucine resistance) n=1 Tax=Poseidonocella sedimentorum TaxID=871652 RepID=A0A1I6EB88_9RHOB|nr:AzlC family ABC transporter permease [Poseidonocella sedimentorum]SFR15000.1 Predicted branched-chain amino acid permease (azaleucine resistance) [Poseidonocella sedimentorum]
MARSTTKSRFWQGVRDGAPFLLVVGPFAMLFGVVATEAGLNLFETMAFSIVVIAGAAQFTALQLLSENALAVIALISALAVNLRMAMYSASITPYLGALPLWKRAIVAYFLVDQTYAVSVAKFERETDMTPRERYAYFIGVMSPVCPLWYVFTLVGALVGSAIPDWLALDFAVPITFLALIAPMLRTGAHVAAAVVAIALALGFAWLPYNLGLLVAALAGMMTGAQVELIASRREDPA